MVVPLSVNSRYGINKGLHFPIGLREIVYLMLKEPNKISKVKWYFDIAEIINILWRVNLLIMIISSGHIYSIVKRKQIRAIVDSRVS